MNIGKIGQPSSASLSQVQASPAPVQTPAAQTPAAPATPQAPAQTHAFESKQEALQQQQKMGVLEKSTSAPSGQVAADPQLSQQLRQGLIASRSQAAPLQGQNFAKGMSDAGAAEKAVKGRPDEDKPMNLFGTQSERTANLKRLTQVDGDMKTRMDEQTCGTHCIVAGLYHQNPEALTKIASKMLERPDLDSLAANTGGDPKKAREALTAIKGGKASPVQIAMLSQLLTVQLKSDPKSGQSVDQGTNDKGLQYLAKNILKDQYGVDVPPMRLNRVENGGVNHWIAQYPTATTADTVDGAKKDHLVTFDPWPAKDGYAPVGVAVSTKDADAQQTKASDVKLLNSLNLGGNRATM